MAGRPLAPQEPGRGQGQRAGAHRGQVLGPLAQALDLTHEGGVDDGLGDAEAARHAQHVAPIDVRQAGEVGEGQAVALDRLAGDAGDDHLRVRQARQELLRAGEVQVGDARIEGENDAGLGGHR